MILYTYILSLQCFMGKESKDSLIIAEEEKVLEASVRVPPLVDFMINPHNRCKIDFSLT
jgi:hypothetical protein